MNDNPLPAGEDEKPNIRVRISITEAEAETGDAERDQELENIGKQVLGIFRWLLILCLGGIIGG